MHIEAEYYSKELKRLKDFVTSNPTLDREKILEWTAECSSLFVSLNVPPTIIQGYLSFFEDYFNHSVKNREVYIWSTPNVASERITNYFYINIAFKVAEANASKMVESDGLVKKALIEILRKDSRLLNVVNGLESMEIAYRSDNPESLMTSSQSVLESLCDIAEDLKRLKNMELKLIAIKTNPKMKGLFGVQDWIVDCFLNIYKPIRNKMVTHKKTLLPYTTPIPMSVATGYAFLVLIFVDMSLTHRKLIRV